jgi:hypothetical protein
LDDTTHSLDPSIIARSHHRVKSWGISVEDLAELPEDAILHNSALDTGRFVAPFCGLVLLLRSPSLGSWSVFPLARSESCYNASSAAATAASSAAITSRHTGLVGNDRNDALESSTYHQFFSGSII